MRGALPRCAPRVFMVSANLLHTVAEPGIERLRRQLLLPANELLGGGVRIAVLDTGIDADHPDLVDRIDLAASRSFSRSIDDLNDRHGHGTHVAGVILGTGAASNGFYRGIAPQATVVAYKTAGSDRGVEPDALAAIDAAIGAGVHIINYSHGHPGKGHPPWLWSQDLNTLEEGFLLAAERGILSIVAAGNCGPNEGSITRPGGLDCVLTVGCLGDNGQVLAMSGRGPYRRSSDLNTNQVERYDAPLHRDRAVAISKPDVVVLGEQITSLRSRDCRRSRSTDQPDFGDPLYLSMTGTSQATAAVSGLVAGLWSRAMQNGIDLGPNPARTIRNLVRRSARSLSQGDVDDFGQGTLYWPVMQSTLSDYVTDAHFRQIILDDRGLTLLPD